MPTYRAQLALKLLLAVLPQERTETTLHSIVQDISVSYCLDATREECLYDEARTLAYKRHLLRQAEP